MTPNSSLFGSLVGAALSILPSIVCLTSVTSTMPPTALPIEARASELSSMGTGAVGVPPSDDSAGVFTSVTTCTTDFGSSVTVGVTSLPVVVFRASASFESSATDSLMAATASASSVLISASTATPAKRLARSGPAWDRRLSERILQITWSGLTLFAAAMATLHSSLETASEKENCAVTMNNTLPISTSSGSMLALLTSSASNASTSKFETSSITISISTYVIWKTLPVTSFDFGAGVGVGVGSGVSSSGVGAEVGAGVGAEVGAAGAAFESEVVVVVVVAVVVSIMEVAFVVVSSVVVSSVVVSAVVVSSVVTSTVVVVAWAEHWRVTPMASSITSSLL
mmetsp:Transcript_25064/g.68891  ORF Transcript_25064/g.68891 Transcript_25064/m.68891 type:complete len:340 (+) Transcript_25064:149-1168(+)